MIMAGDGFGGIGADWSATTPEELVRSHVGRGPHTGRAYGEDLRTFARFAGHRDPVEAVRQIVERPRGAAQRTLHDYLNWLRGRYALNTARRKVSSLRGLLRLAHEFGVIHWAIVAMPLPTPEPIRDTRGPGRRELQTMLAHCEGRGDAKGARDTAILRLMGVCGYRCNEVLTLDLRHIDLDAREVEILGKGNWGTSRRRWPVDLLTARAIGRWLEFRGVDEGPLLTTLQRNRARDGERLTYWGVYQAVTDLGRRTGIGHCHPHALRHTAATEFLRLTNGNIAWAMALTRHRDPKTVMVYNDERLRRAREAMEIVARGVPVYRYEPDAQDNY